MEARRTKTNTSGCGNLFPGKDVIVTGSPIKITMDYLYDLVDQGFSIFPVREKPGRKYFNKKKNKWIIPKEKTPYVANGFYRATRDKRKIKNWFNNERYKDCMWGYVTGDIFVMDYDTYKDADLEIDEYSEKTRQVFTAHGGIQSLFRNSEKINLRCTTEKLAKGLDTRGYGGYAILPGSTILGELEEKTGETINVNLPYVWGNNLPIAELPKELIERLQKAKRKNLVNNNGSNINNKNGSFDKKQVVIALSKLKKERCENRNMWRDVGLALHNGFEGSQEGLAHWDIWSKSAPEKYEEGKCAEEWNSFDNEKENKITIASLFFWAQEDGSGTFVKSAPKKAKPSHYLAALHALNYHFSINEMNDRLFLNGDLFNDNLLSVIMTKLREYGYWNKSLALDAMIAEGYENRFHPVKNYLESLVWNGKDNIKELASYIKSEEDLFELLLRKWMIGAVSKIYNPLSPLEQNPMLVWDGKQKIGKSVLVAWLGNVLPQFFKTSPVYPENKDHVIDSCSYFVWEVEELSGTIRKADREALKAYLTRIKVDIRVPYGRFNVEKPVTCSYIGTLNDEGGFLNDPTGNRRFRVCKINFIDWNYRKYLNANQLWAQAVALFKSGETYELEMEQEDIINEINSRYEIEDTLLDHILEYFKIEKENDLVFTSTSQIISTLRKNGLIHNEFDKAISMRISAILTKVGLEKKRKSINGQKMRVWIGISLIDSDEDKSPL